MATQLTTAKCGCSEEVGQHSLYPLRVLHLPLSRCEHTLWGHFLHPIPTGLATSMQIAPFLCHQGGLASRRGRDGVESVFPISKRLYGKTQKRSTASPTQFHCQSLWWPLIPIEKRAPSWREDWAFTQPSSFYKMSTKPELNWSVSWSRKHRSWLEDTMIGGSNRPGGMSVASMDGQADRCHLSRGIFPGELGQFYQVTVLVHFLCSSPPLNKWSAGHCHATG